MAKPALKPSGVDVAQPEVIELPHRHAVRKAAVRNIAFSARTIRTVATNPLSGNPSMTESAHDVSAPAAPPDSSPALENTAVAHYREVWESTRRQALNEGNRNVLARVAPPKRRTPTLPLCRFAFLSFEEIF
jgi:hypothetical protein